MYAYRPKMGEPPMPDEGDLPDLPDLPFGYNFTEADYSRPPPTRGDPILDTDDSNFLGDFFNGMESNVYNNLSFGEGLTATFTDNWPNQFAPSLLGHSTSFGPQPIPGMGSSASMTGMAAHNSDNIFRFGEQGMMPPPILRQQQLVRQQPHPAPQQPRPQSQPVSYPLVQNQPSHLSHDQRNFHTSSRQDAGATVAAVLTGIRSRHQNDYPSRTINLDGFDTSASPQPRRQYRASFSQINPSSNDFAQRLVRPEESNALFFDMFGRQESTATRPAEMPSLQWGSDAHFSNSRFVPPQHESSEALENRRLTATREALLLSYSVPDTRPSSSAGNKETPPQAALEKSNENTSVSPRKRQKSTAETDEEDGGQSPSRAVTKRRKSKVDQSLMLDKSSLPQMFGKRKRFKPVRSKQSRENLTIEQKRENHIKSEQKRRETIKEGFEDLMFIVPDLQNGGYSKSNVLNIAGDWLEALVKGNEMLESKDAHTLF